MAAPRLPRTVQALVILAWACVLLLAVHVVADADTADSGTPGAAEPVADAQDVATQPAPPHKDDSVCYKDCSGHGVCENWICICDVGYFGEDCSKSYLQRKAPIPILAAGHFNISCRNLPKAVQKYPLLLVGSSGPSCDKCIVVEHEYDAVAPKLKDMNIAFGRLNAEKCANTLSQLGIFTSPALIMYRDRKATVYSGEHSEKALLGFAQKQVAPAVIEVNNAFELAQFIQEPLHPHPTPMLQYAVVVAVLPDTEDGEEAEEDLQEAAKQLHGTVNIYFAATHSSALIQFGKQMHWIYSATAPFLLVFKVSGAIRAPTTSEDMLAWFTETDMSDPVVLRLDEFKGDDMSLADWITQRSLPLVGPMTPTTFALYEALKLPMLILFIDCDRLNPIKLYGGTSGGVPNAQLLEPFKMVAKIFQRRISFMFADGRIHREQMRSLGLTGGLGNLPAMAFNVRDGRAYRFPDSTKYTVDNIKTFCEDFLRGSLKPVSDVLSRNRKPIKEQPGVRELFHDEVDGEYVKHLGPPNFDRVVMTDDARDVVILFHASDEEDSAAATPYYKRVAKRFKELEVPNLLLARFDCAEFVPPISVTITQLPMLVMVPAYRKSPPFLVYSGQFKVAPIMSWISLNSGNGFELPTLAQFTDEEAQLYKQQIRERKARADAQAAAAGAAGAAPATEVSSDAEL